MSAGDRPSRAAEAPGSPTLARPHGRRGLRLMFWSLPFIVAGTVSYLFGVLIAVPRWALTDALWMRQLNEHIVWYSGVPMFIGLVMTLLDFFVLLPDKRQRLGVINQPLPADAKVTVTLTAYNDEPSIAQAVADFLAHPRVARVIVVDNNSKDGTAEAARRAGAIVVSETAPGYGQCVTRCLKEGARFDDTPAVVLCEGDCTFRAADIDKLLAYAPHATIVGGTRIAEQLREYSTQLSTFMYYGNFVVGKLLEAKHLGRGTFTDVGTTYKLLRRDAIERLLAVTTPRVNLEFNCHFLDRALAAGERIVECPITFYARVGISKGGNVSDRRAFKVGIGMIWGLYTNWRWSGR